jgi:hypothetical protein
LSASIVYDKTTLSCSTVMSFEKKEEVGGTKNTIARSALTTRRLVRRGALPRKGDKRSDLHATKIGDNNISTFSRAFFRTSDDVTSSQPVALTG